MTAKFTSKWGLGPFDTMRMFEKLIELCHLEMEGHQAMVISLRTARQRADKQGKLTRELNGAVQDEVKWRLAQLDKLRDTLSAYRRQRDDWAAKVHSRRGGMPVVYNVRDKMIDPRAVLIDRTTPFGNPHPMRVMTHAERERVLAKFREYLFNTPALLEKVRTELKGVPVKCHCAPLRCHGDILVEVANYLETPGRRQPTWIVSADLQHL